MLRRDKRAGDPHFGKHVGLGGHVERDEDVVTCVRREIFEESGLIAGELTLRGTILWTGWGVDNVDLLCFVFRVDSFTGEPHAGNEEGTLTWVPVADLTNLPMWTSDHQWLPMVFDNDPRQFHGLMPYRDGEMIGWSYQRL